MKLQTAVFSEKPLEDPKGFLQTKYPEKFSLIQEWEELGIALSAQFAGGNEYILYIDIPEERFTALKKVFPSEEEAKITFRMAAMERGWEPVPDSYLIYHAEIGRNGLTVALGEKDTVVKYGHVELGHLIGKLSESPRVIVYSNSVLAYVRNIYPEITIKSYVIAEELFYTVGSSWEMEEIAKLYGVALDTMEDKVKFMKKLLQNPVRLPCGVVNLRPFHYPVRARIA